MFRIEETQDVDLTRKGLHWKVIEGDFGARTSVVGYFSDHAKAALVCEALNATAQVVVIGEVS